jgi:O-antigen ligase
MNRPKFLSILDRTVLLGLFLILLLAPTQSAFELMGAYISPVDPIVWLTAGLWLVTVVLRPETTWQKRFLTIMPPLENILFIALVALSLVSAADRLAGLKELVQFAEYAIAGFLLFSVGVKTRREVAWLGDLFLVTVSLVILLGTLHYFQSSRDALEVCSTFGNRNIYSGFVAVTLPFVLVSFIQTSCPWRRLWLGLVILGGLFSILAGGSALALVVATTLVCALRSRRWLIGWLATLLILVAVAFPFLPRENVSILRDSIALYTEDIEVHPRYIEWQADIQMWQEAPWLGIGLGNYQREIGMYYGFLPMPEGAKEPDHNNLFLVTASSTGILGLAGLIVMLAGWLGRGMQLCGRRQTDADDAGWCWGAGAVGAIIAFAIASLWSALLVRGVSPALVFLGAMPYAWMRLTNVDRESGT